MRDDIHDLRGRLDNQDDDPSSGNSFDDWLVYDTVETPKTIEFQMLDGSRQHFVYGHYIKAWIGSEGGDTLIRVFFSTDTVTLNGYCLDQLYDALRQLKVSVIRANAERYAQTMTLNDTDPFVSSITIEKHGKGG